MNQDNDNNVTEESLTVDYNDLYKLEYTDDDDQPQHLNPDDLQFDSGDHIEDESLARKKDLVDTKRNLTFMGIIILILIVIVLFLFPLIFKFINK